jgi:cellobiose phosphorylase
LRIDPVIPPDWDGFKIHYKFGSSVYRIQVNNPEHVTRHVRQILLDEQPQNNGFIPLFDDHHEHQAIVTMGNSSK